jgi:hypothetical protein
MLDACCLLLMLDSCYSLLFARCLLMMLDACYWLKKRSRWQMPAATKTVALMLDARCLPLCVGPDLPTGQATAGNLSRVAFHCHFGENAYEILVCPAGKIPWVQGAFP